MHVFLREKKLTDMSSITMKAGHLESKKGVTLQPEFVIIHKDYQGDEDPKTHDIALIFLKEEVKIGGRMNTICLPDKTVQDLGSKVRT